MSVRPLGAAVASRREVATGRAEVPYGSAPSLSGCDAYDVGGPALQVSIRALSRAQYRASCCP
ncbi:protein of unknown function [Methylorubrum extorquens DM4]|uniref:Uncharacterized protein n=1 Tax=Methylorubrum extorquens (strain DSM 6343 / CIP 106787 / DM4) TaxID=661410 RepID=C7CJR2_METED|nr:protein of unknown function [Methylorubrum extorquens DM4]